MTTKPVKSVLQIIDGEFILRTNESSNKYLYAHERYMYIYIDPMRLRGIGAVNQGNCDSTDPKSSID